MNASLTLIARLLLATMFVIGGIAKFGNLGGTAAYIASGGLPLAGLLAPLVAAFELVAGILLVVGFQARWAALGLALFTIAASLGFHRFWAVAPDAAFVQQLLFTKNLAVAGGLLFVFLMGAGALSLDGRRAHA